MRSVSPNQQQVVIVGLGYTGRRVSCHIDGAIAVSRRSRPESPSHEFFARDLDSPKIADIDVGGPYSLLYTVPPSAAPDQRMERLLNALNPQPSRIVYLSTSGVYGDQQRKITSETTPPAPVNERAKRRLAAEQQLSEYSAPLVILRVPGIYGPGRLGIERINNRIPVIDEADTSPGNRIHVEDLVGCCLAALASETPPGIYNVGDGDHRSSTWFAQTVAKLAGIPAPPTVSRDIAERTFNEKRLSFLRESRKLDIRKMREVLRYAPNYVDAEDGIQASLVFTK